MQELEGERQQVRSNSKDGLVFFQQESELVANRACEKDVHSLCKVRAPAFLLHPISTVFHPLAGANPKLLIRVRLLYAILYIIWDYRHHYALLLRL